MITRSWVLVGLATMLIAPGLASCRLGDTSPLTEIAVTAPRVPTVESTVQTETVAPTRTAPTESRTTPTESPTPTATAPPPTTTAEGKASFISFQAEGDAWIIDGAGQDPQRIASGALPLSWSPSGKSLLLMGNKELYLADAFGSEPKLLYQDENIYQIGVETQWLNDRIVLLEIWEDEFDSHIHYLDVDTGEVHKPDPDDWRLLEAVSVRGQFWIQSSLAGDYEIADLSGKRTPILQDYSFGGGTQPAQSPNIVLLPSGEGAFFSDCVSGSCNIYLAMFPNQQPGTVTPVFEWGKEGERNLWNLSVSPDGRYLAFVYGERELYFLDIASQKVEYKWPWSENYFPAFYLWSPSSDAIVYRSWNRGTKRDDLLKLEVTTGESQILTHDIFVVHLADWRYIVTP